jgi:hypothetical protein
LHAFLGEVPIARLSNQRRDDATPLVVKSAGDCGFDVVV